MEFNGSKFELIRYGNNTDLKLCTKYITENGGDIEQKNSIKDLGIFMCDDAQFKLHIHSTINSARKLTSWILRTFKTREKVCMLTLWKALVLPKIEYCCQLWSPTKVGDIQNIEALQRTFTHKINGFQDYNYWERLKALNLYSLERRRDRYNIIYAWKIMFQIYRIIIPN